MAQKESSRLQILMSCMHQHDMRLVDASNIRTDVLMVNQCDAQDIIREEREWGSIVRYDVRERGLSRSRNFAMEHSQGEFCLIADDDEWFEEDCREKIVQAFDELPQADIIIFHISNEEKRMKETVHRVRFPEVLHVISYQIAFRRKSVADAGVKFDVHMGAGTPNGAEEEVKFLMDCMKAGLRIWNVPVVIATIREDSTSTWFEGFDERFFENRGMTTRHMMGYGLSVLYGIYYVMKKKPKYRDKLTMGQAWKCLYKGISENKLGKMESNK